MFLLRVFLLLVLVVLSVVGRGIPFEEQETLGITEEQMKFLLGKTPPGPIDPKDKRGSLTDYKWPSSREDGKFIVKIPYILDEDINSKMKLIMERSIREVQMKTCIRFRPKNNEHDYVYFKKGTGCSSDIGRRSGGQEVIIGEGCGYKGLVLHEMMHLLGYHHEHNRMDRDQFVRIFEENILEAGKDQILPKYQTDNQGLPYDLRSVMHYSKSTFAKKDGLVTMEARNNPAMEIGNHDGLSALDVQRLNRFYRCSEQRIPYKNYDVTVKTADSLGSGTDAFVYLKLVGERGESDENEVAKGQYENDFENDATEHFQVAFKDVGKITQLKVILKKNPNGSYFDGWTMEKVIIKDDLRTYTFNGPKDLDPGGSVTLTAS